MRLRGAALLWISWLLVSAAVHVSALDVNPHVRRAAPDVEGGSPPRVQQDGTPSSGGRGGTAVHGPPPTEPQATLTSAESLYGHLRNAITPHGRFDRVAETVAELLSVSKRECARVLDLVTRRGTFWYPLLGGCVLKNDTAACGAIETMVSGCEVPLTARGPIDVPPLHVAAQLGSASLTRRLLTAGARADAHTDRHGGAFPFPITALHLAAWIKDRKALPLARYLLLLGAARRANLAGDHRAAAAVAAQAVRQLDGAGLVLLVREAKDRRRDGALARLLRAAEVDGVRVVHARDVADALDEQAEELVELMLAPQAAGTQRQRVLKGDKNRDALEPPPPIEVDSREGWAGWTPLHVAAHCGAKRTALALLKNGADPTRTEDHMDMTPAHLAAAQGYGDLLGLLEEAAAPDVVAAAAAEGWEGDVAAVDREGRSPRSILRHTLPPKQAENGGGSGDEGADNGSSNVETLVASTHDNGGWHSQPSTRVVAALKDRRARGRCDIAVVDGGLDPTDFAADYLHVGRPLLLRGAAAAWDFRRAWRRDALMSDPNRSRAGVIASAIPNGGLFGLVERRTDIATFAAEMRGVRGGDGADDGDGTRADPHGAGPVEGGKGGEGGDPPPSYVYVNIRSTVSPSAGPVPNSTASTTAFLAQDFPKLPDFFPDDGSVKPLAHQLYMGASGSGTPHHFHGAAWNAIAWGRKRWFMHPPSRARYSTVHPLVAIEEKSRRDSATLAREYKSDDEDALECTQEAGDVIFVPHSWGHAVINLVETVGVAGELATGNILNGGKHPSGDAPPGRFRPPARKAKEMKIDTPSSPPRGVQESYSDRAEL